MTSLSYRHILQHRHNGMRMDNVRLIAQALPVNAVMRDHRQPCHSVNNIHASPPALRACSYPFPTSSILQSCRHSPQTAHVAQGLFGWEPSWFIIPLLWDIGQQPPLRIIYAATNTLTIHRQFKNYSLRQIKPHYTASA